MHSKLVDALALTRLPVAVILTDERPGEAMQFKEGRWGCVAARMLAVARGKTVVFDRKTFGCAGGGTGIGFGDQYATTGLAIDRLLSTGNKGAAGTSGSRHMVEGERFFESPEVVRRWLQSMPIRDVPTEYVVMKPLHQVAQEERPEVIVFFVNADQLSALVFLTDFGRGSGESAIAPFGAACQSILYAYAEAEREVPRGVIGFFDISQRHRVDRDTLTYTLPYQLFLELESNVDDSFLLMKDWQQLRERQ